MKTYLVNSLLMLAVSTPVLAEDGNDQWGAETNGIQMSIKLSNGALEVKTNQPIKLVIRYRNVSTNESFPVSVGGHIEFDSSFTWTIISPSGKDISPDMLFHANQWANWYTLKPQKSKDVEYDLSVRCNFFESGTYKITLQKGISSDTTQRLFTVVSNPLNVTIVPGKKPLVRGAL